MDGRELPVHGDSKHLCEQMCPEQVCDGLVVLEVSWADPDLGQQPVVLTISGQEDRVDLTWSLPQLEETEDERGRWEMDLYWKK